METKEWEGKQEKTTGIARNWEYKIKDIITV